MRKNAFLQAWALTENAIRRIRTTLKNIPASGSILNHCQALFSTDLNHPRATEFMELIRLVTKTRNTIHNDFSYYPDKGGNDVLMYQGHTFSFDVGKQVTFFTWDFVHKRMNDLIEVYEQTVRHGIVSKISNIPAH